MILILSLSTAGPWLVHKTKWPKDKKQPWRAVAPRAMVLGRRSKRSSLGCFVRVTALAQDLFADASLIQKLEVARSEKWKSKKRVVILLLKHCTRIHILRFCVLYVGFIKGLLLLSWIHDLRRLLQTTCIQCFLHPHVTYLSSLDLMPNQETLLQEACVCWHKPTWGSGPIRYRNKEQNVLFSIERKEESWLQQHCSDESKVCSQRSKFPTSLWFHAFKNLKKRKHMCKSSHRKNTNEAKGKHNESKRADKWTLTPEYWQKMGKKAESVLLR